MLYNSHVTDRYPLKQGLKQATDRGFMEVFLGHRPISTKTRIETTTSHDADVEYLVTDRYPLKQGLKP